MSEQLISPSSLRAGSYMEVLAALRHVIEEVYWRRLLHTYKNASVFEILVKNTELGEFWIGIPFETTTLPLNISEKSDSF